MNWLAAIATFGVGIVCLSIGAEVTRIPIEGVVIGLLLAAILAVVSGTYFRKRR